MAFFDVLKAAAKVAQEAGKIELYGQILEVNEKLLEQQKHIADLEEANTGLQKQLKIKEALKYESNAYWILKNDGFKDGPYCTRCWDVESNTVRMTRGVNNPSIHNCPECKGQFQTVPGYRPVFTSRRRSNPAE